MSKNAFSKLINLWCITLVILLVGAIFLLIENESLAILFLGIVFFVAFSFLAKYPEKYDNFLDKVNVFSLPMFPKDKIKRIKIIRVFYIICAIFSFLMILFSLLIAGLPYLFEWYLQSLS